MLLLLLLLPGYLNFPSAQSHLPLTSPSPPPPATDPLLFPSGAGRPELFFLWWVVNVSDLEVDRDNSLLSRRKEKEKEKVFDISIRWLLCR
ncbi:hypothetical protein Pmani_021515 [Petrolisthes manimaculis]|uniref:Secreted protein n=1 Tax=Petrolisthes manimaculis TaxID=1843537 RepID=A0AAE1U347_9EUCA|nr:hypothetical protein Pmani_021515 [Petrolisthes manimaculis]